jgi:hypothetical protein
MGLALRYNLFNAVDAEAVYGALASYWASRRHELTTRTARTPPMRTPDEYVLHRERAGWTLLSWDAGWEWIRRREAQWHVSRALGCAGLLVFVYDGQYWGYELFDRGEPIDHFVSTGVAEPWFPGRDCTGRPGLLLTALPERPTATSGPGIDAVLRGRARPPGHGALDFLDLLGVDLERGEADEPWWYVTPTAPRWRAFAVELARPPSPDR